MNLLKITSFESEGRGFLFIINHDAALKLNIIIGH